MGCKKAQGFLERTGQQVENMVDATKEKYGREEALALARWAAKLVVGRGTKVRIFDMSNDSPTDDELAALLLGPTGNLKAPTLRIGNTLLVGFNEEAYKHVLSTRLRKR